MGDGMQIIQPHGHPVVRPVASGHAVSRRAGAALVDGTIWLTWY
jgi:hypothetical protein